MYQKLKDFLVPHEGNNYKPSSLEKVAVFGMMLLILLSFTVANLQSLIWMSSEWMVSTILPAVIVDLTNEERADMRLRDLKRSPTLDLAATLKAQDMAQNEYFAHYSPKGISPWYWFAEAGYNFVHAGENLAIHFTDSSEVVTAWMNSPTHRANIVNSNYTEIGVGTARGTYEGFDTVYVVQLFGTPAAAAPVAVAEAASQPRATEVPSPAVLSETESASETELAQEPEPEPDTQTSTTTPVVPVLPIIAGSEEVVEESTSTRVVLSTDRDPVVVNETANQEVATTASSTLQKEEVHVVFIEDEVVLYSDMVSTTTGGIPSSIDPTETSPVSTSPILAAATQPHIVLQVLYSIIALFVFLALSLSIFIEIRRQHPIQIAYSSVLVAVMLGLFYIHSVVTAGAMIV